MLYYVLYQKLNEHTYCLLRANLLCSVPFFSITAGACLFSSKINVSPDFMGNVDSTVFVSSTNSSFGGKPLNTEKEIFTSLFRMFSCVSLQCIYFYENKM